MISFKSSVFYYPYLYSNLGRILWEFAVNCSKVSLDGGPLCRKEVWVGTDDGSLCIFSALTFRMETQKNVASSAVESMEMVGEHIWVSTLRFIHVYNPSNHSVINEYTTGGGARYIQLMGKSNIWYDHPFKFCCGWICTQETDRLRVCVGESVRWTTSKYGMLQLVKCERHRPRKMSKRHCFSSFTCQKRQR